MTAERAEVIVVGGGVIGIAAALELANRGIDTLVIERDAILTGASYGNAGLICPSHAESLAGPTAVWNGLRWMWRRDSPFYIRPRPALVPWLTRFVAASRPSVAARSSEILRSMAEEGLGLHQDLAAAGVATSFARRGVLSVFESDHLMAATRRRLAAARPGTGPDLLTGAEANALEPAVRPDVAGALYHSGDGHCIPAAYVTAVGAEARRLGATLLTGVEVLGLELEGGRVAGLTTTEGRFQADRYVLAAGMWTRELARRVGLTLPLEGAKGYHLELADGAVELTIPVFMEEAKVTATPMGPRVRLAGTLELAGMDLSVDPVRVGALSAAAGRVLRAPPDLAPPPVAEPARVWRGLRPCTPDGLPIIGAAPGLPNLILATGHAMLGLMLAPSTGRAVASLVVGDRPARDLSPFRASRFGNPVGRWTGTTTRAMRGQRTMTARRGGH